MTKKLYLLLWLTTAVFASKAQLTPFSPCPGTQVLVYKDGTNCTEAPYHFYTMDLAGNLTPFGTSTDPGVEINGIGINQADNLLYGLRYTRTTGANNTCSFTNTHLIRVDAVGTTIDLGLLPVPSGATLSTAFGTVSSNGEFIYYLTINNTIYLGVISNVQSLPANGTPAAVYIPITNNCPNKLIADWALSPVDGNLYSYATYPELVGSTYFMRGTVIKIDLTTKVLTCVGSPNTTEFLDPERDNFGGIVFAGNDNSLYGINVNTRKLYKINISTGALLQTGTIAGSGNMRLDLASCTSAPTTLPVKLSSFDAVATGCHTQLSWKLEAVEDVVSQVVMYSADGQHFSDLSTIADKTTRQYFDGQSRNGDGYYRLKITEYTGFTAYSAVKKVVNNCMPQSALVILGNPVSNQLEVNYNNITPQKINAEVLDFAGKKLLTKAFSLTASSGRLTLTTTGLSAGMYLLKITDAGGTVRTEKFIKK